MQSPLIKTKDCLIPQEITGFQEPCVRNWGQRPIYIFLTINHNITHLITESYCIWQRISFRAYNREQKLKIVKTHEDWFSSVKVRRWKILASLDRFIGSFKNQVSSSFDSHSHKTEAHAGHHIHIPVSRKEDGEKEKDDDTPRRVCSLKESSRKSCTTLVICASAPRVIHMAVTRETAEYRL